MKFRQINNERRGNRIKKIKWAFKQLLPLSYVSEYSTSGHREVAAWRMWLGRTFGIKRWKVA